MTANAFLRLSIVTRLESRMRVHKTFLIAALAAVAACHSPTETDRASSDLEASRNRWAAQHLSRYDFTFEQFCFCALPGPLRVSVRDGTVVSATVISTGTSVDTQYIPTVDGLFALIERGITSHVAVLRVTYDPTRGFPVEIYSDGSPHIADDEVTYTVKDLVGVN